MTSDKRKAQNRAAQATYVAKSKARLDELIAKFKEAIALGAEIIAEIEKYKN